MAFDKKVAITREAGWVLKSAKEYQFYRIIESIRTLGRCYTMHAAAKYIFRKILIVLININTGNRMAESISGPAVRMEYQEKEKLDLELYIVSMNTFSSGIPNPARL